MATRDKLNMTPAAVSAAVRGDLENFLVAATPGGIERQEAMGQAAFVGTRNTLPKRCPRAELERLGFVFGTDADDLFVNVTLPAGWKKQATDHSMWSDLIDDKGRKRGGIFYKAAFYDRSAHMNLDRRYTTKTNWLDEDGKDSYTSAVHTSISVVDHATGKTLFETDKIKFRDWDGEKEIGKIADAWLESNFPNNKDASAYWD